VSVQQLFNNSMKKLKSGFFFRVLVLFFLVTYIGCSFTNMLFIPRYVQVFSKTPVGQGFSFTRLVKYDSFHARNFLQIIDKYTLDNDQVNSFSFIPKSFIIIFTGCCLSGKKSSQLLRISSILFNCQYTYLFFRRLRI